MIKKSALMLAALTLAVSTGVAAKELKVGFVNSAILLDKAPQAEAARKQLEKEFSPREHEIEELQKSIQTMEQKLNREAPAMSDAERSRQERELNRRMRELQRKQAEFRDDLNLRKNEELAKLQRTVFQVIHEMAKEEGYDLILSDGVVYAGPNVDVTDMVLQRLSTK